MNKYNRFTVPAKGHNGGMTGEALSVIIPAAGTGHRMKSYGPKCLLPISPTETILYKIITNVRSIYPNSEITVVVGFEADRVIKVLPDDIRIIENQFYQETNVVESLRLALNSIVNKNVLVVYGDLIFNTNAIDGLTNEKSCIVVDSKHNFKNEEVGVTVVDDMVTNFAYGLDTKWGQIIYLENEALLLFKTLCANRKRNKMYPFELFNMIMNEGINIRAIEPKGMEIQEVDSLKDIKYESTDI
jgi:choline kinase